MATAFCLFIEPVLWIATFTCQSVPSGYYPPTSWGILVDLVTILTIHVQAMLNLKPGRPLKTISYRSLPVNSNNLGKVMRVRRKLVENWHPLCRTWRRGAGPSEVTNGVVEVVHFNQHLDPPEPSPPPESKQGGSWPAPQGRGQVSWE